MALANAWNWLEAMWLWHNEHPPCQLRFRTHTHNLKAAASSYLGDDVSATPRCYRIHALFEHDELRAELGDAERGAAWLSADAVR